MTYVLDRFEGDTVILIADDGKVINMPADGFRERREGDVFTGDSSDSLVFDEAGTSRRRKAVRERFAELRRRPPTDNS